MDVQTALSSDQNFIQYLKEDIEECKRNIETDKEMLTYDKKRLARAQRTLANWETRLTEVVRSARGGEKDL